MYSRINMRHDVFATYVSFLYVCVDNLVIPASLKAAVENALCLPDLFPSDMQSRCIRRFFYLCATLIRIATNVSICITKIKGENVNM